MTAPGQPIEVHAEFPDAQWTTFVQSHPDATLYHTTVWRDFIADVFGHTPRYLVARDGDRIAGVLPLFHIRVPLVGSKLISLPYDIGSGGALAESEAVEQQLATTAMTLARELGVDYLELRHGSARPALASLGLRTQEPVLISDMTLESEAAVAKRIASDHRKAVRKASSRGVTVREAETLNDFMSFYDVYLRVFREFGTPPYAARYFSELWRRLQSTGGVKLFLAETGRPLHRRPHHVLLAADAREQVRRVPAGGGAVACVRGALLARDRVRARGRLRPVELGHVVRGIRPG